MKENWELLLGVLSNDSGLNIEDFYSITIRESKIVMQAFYNERLAKKIRNMGVFNISESGFIECEVTNLPIDIILTSNK